MKKRSSKKDGFTLLEVVISMMLITILSVGVYNAYIMIIRNTKDGEVKQEATLVGKKVIEEIKSGERQPMNGTIDFDMNFQPITTSSSAYYKVNITAIPQDISINKGESGNRFFVGENRISDKENDVKTTTLINDNKTIEINIDEFGNGVIRLNNDVPFNNLNYVGLDFKYYSDESEISILVKNNSKKQLNLYIWNSKNDDTGYNKVQAENKLGALNISYRNDAQGKSGRLNKITVSVDAKNSRGTFDNNVFNTDIYENIN
ncbi:MAG: Prokaryotic N-methylation motif protein [Clostridium butyricum DORA_1]|nr:MAG: Prokaryotic N-methylation motif protein [Clostridium butyricum DORA_1]MDU1509193.1 prepilin-type N-terminal cleavage/methylation domain-containing protein [Clostridium butyricum]